MNDDTEAAFFLRGILWGESCKCYPIHQWNCIELALWIGGYHGKRSESGQRLTLEGA